MFFALAQLTPMKRLRLQRLTQPFIKRSCRIILDGKLNGRLPHSRNEEPQADGIGLDRRRNCHPAELVDFTCQVLTEPKYLFYLLHSRMLASRRLKLEFLAQRIACGLRRLKRL